MIVEVLIFALVFLIVNELWKRHKKLAAWNHFPGPKGWQALPFMGHSYMLAPKPVQALLKMQKQYGDVFRLDLGPTPTVIVADYDLGKKMYKTEVRIGSLIFTKSSFIVEFQPAALSAWLGKNQRN